MTFDAEKSLIGALLIDPKAVKDCGNLRPDMFCNRLLGQVYQEFLRAYDFGYPANLVTLRENLSDVPQCSLLDLVRECSSASVTSVAAGKYAETIVRSYKARSAAGIVSAANFLPSGIDQQIGQVINELEALQDGGRLPGTWARLWMMFPVGISQPAIGRGFIPGFQSWIIAWAGWRAAT